MAMISTFGRKHSGALKVRDFDFEIKAVGDDGTFDGYGSVWDVVDSYQEIVAKGDLVTIIYESKGLIITLRGRANEAGAMGDVISVTNPQSKRVVQGKVSGQGRVNVQPSAAGRIASAN